MPLICLCLCTVHANYRGVKCLLCVQSSLLMYLLMGHLAYEVGNMIACLKVVWIVDSGGCLWSEGEEEGVEA